MIGALFVVVIGTWFLLQSTNIGDRIASYFGDEPDDAGAKSSAFTPTNWNRKALRVMPWVPRGDRVVYDTIMPACSRAGGGFTVISWHRPTDSDSCHRFGKRTRKGALDIQPPKRNGKFQWAKADKLAAELRSMGLPEVIFRGDADHDPDLGADPPHVHAAVNCG